MKSFFAPDHRFLRHVVQDGHTIELEATGIHHFAITAVRRGSNHDAELGNSGQTGAASPDKVTRLTRSVH